MKKIRCSLILFILLGSSSCSDNLLSTDVKDHFFLKNDGAVMPVFVNGNTSSKVFVIYLHGGPGATALEAYQNNTSPFFQLQQKYAVVYWDQRCSGAAQGQCNNLTMSSYVDDLDKLITLLQYRYAPDLKIFLIGHSWGGSLGIRYLTTADNQSKVSGWIEVGGGHNVPKIVMLEREMVNEVGNRQIALGNQVVAWQDKMVKANALNLSDVDDLYEMNRIAVQCEQLMTKADSVNKKIGNSFFKDYFFSPLDPGASPVNSQQTFKAMKNELAVLDLSENTALITIPTLLIWGKYDFRVPPAFAKEAFDQYGASKKELFLFDRSAHFVQWNQPALFYETVTAFIEMNR